MSLFAAMVVIVLLLVFVPASLYPLLEGGPEYETLVQIQE